MSNPSLTANLVFVFVITSFFNQCRAHHTNEEPPKGYQEHWYEHSSNLTWVYLNETAHIAVYFDPDVDRNATWLFEFTAQVWSYMTRTYGEFGPDPYLYLVIHQGKYPGRHHGLSIDKNSIHGNRNLVDLGSASMKSWVTPSSKSDEMDMLVNELGYFVEKSSKNRIGSPSIRIWSSSRCAVDKPWNDIFTYDVYKNLNLTSEAERYKRKMMYKVYEFPKLGTFWFKDWFLPIYNSSRKGEGRGGGWGNLVLNKYFELLSEHVKHEGQFYTGFLTMGSFVHFWSGAAGRNLKDLAVSAFDWDSVYEREWQEAREDFPVVSLLYKCSNNCNETMSKWKVIDEDSKINSNTKGSKQHKSSMTKHTIVVGTSIAINGILLSILVGSIIYFRAKVDKLEKVISNLSSQAMKDYFDREPNLNVNVNVPNHHDSRQNLATAEVLSA